jgi:hypothetical protein
MSGSLTISKGVLYVGTEEKTAHVRSFDLDGNELEAGFSFRGPGGAAASVEGLDVDEDHRLWVADGVSGRLCVFTLFGEEIAGVETFATGTHDKGGLLGSVADVVSFGSDDEQQLLVASGGRRRHALQLLELGSGRTVSLRSLGHVDRAFADLSGVARRDDLIFACERGSGRVQVFRERDFHFSFEVPLGAGRRFTPTALEALPDGRLLVAHAGAASALLLLDQSGRLERVLADSGRAEGQVSNPTDLAVELGADERQTRVLAIDEDGTRVQVFNLQGNCYGTFPGFARSETTWRPE